MTTEEYHASGWRGRGVSIALLDMEIRRRRSGLGRVHLQGIEGPGKYPYCVLLDEFFSFS